MEQQGYNVMTAQSGEFALDLICQSKPNLILLDIMLPGIDGWEICEIVRLNPAGTVLLVSLLMLHYQQ